MSIKNNWTFDEIKSIYNKPLLELMYEAATIHRQLSSFKEQGRRTRLVRHQRDDDASRYDTY